MNKTVCFYEFYRWLCRQENSYYKMCYNGSMSIVWTLWKETLQGTLYGEEESCQSFHRESGLYVSLKII